MYDENSFKNHIFWIKVKRIFFIILFSVIGAALGIVISSYLIDILLFDEQLRNIIIAGSTIILFLISLLVTANTGKEVQDGYWKIAVLRKLTLISKKLDNLDNLENLNNLSTLLDLKVNTLSKEPISQTDIQNNTEKENTESYTENMENKKENVVDNKNEDINNTPEENNEDINE